MPKYLLAQQQPGDMLNPNLSWRPCGVIPVCSQRSYSEVTSGVSGAGAVWWFQGRRHDFAGEINRTMTSGHLSKFKPQDCSVVNRASLVGLSELFSRQQLPVAIRNEADGSKTFKLSKQWAETAVWGLKRLKRLLSQCHFTIDHIKVLISAALN